MAPDASSNIRVFIRWHDQTVFAGEEVKCTITFKNVASGSNQPRPQPPPERSRLASPLRPKSNHGLTPPPSAASGRGHFRSALSLSVPSSRSHSRSGSVQWPAPTSSTSDRHPAPGHAHKRSLSIVSIASNSTVDDLSQRNEPPMRGQRQPRGHGRASSLQIVPRAQNQPSPGPQSASFSSPRLSSSPLFHASYPPPDRFGRMSRPPTVPNTPRLGNQRRSPLSSPNLMPEFRFPAAPSPTAEAPPNQLTATNEHMLSPNVGSMDPHNLAFRSKEPVPTINEQAAPAPAARILASSGILGGTPRSSGEFYSVSNNSSETLVSEYVTQPPVRGHERPLRRSLGLPSPQQRAPESLMMGYAQLQGSFTLDGSLVSLGQFEQVKKKAIVGGQGGGVVGVDSAKRDSGLLRGFGWGKISSSLGDFLGGGELSTIKEMRGVANAKAVPLLATPQSILFVDLQLAPGESRVFEYSFRLPKGLPPTHRGKAVKISYSLVVGTQRVGGAKEQQVRSVEVPFRVLGSVNSHGEILGHDLMNPYVLLRDQAQVKTQSIGSKEQKPNGSNGRASTMNDFLLYVDDLVSRPRDESGSILLAPTPNGTSRRPSAFEESTTTQESIHLAIMRSNMTSGEQQSPNRFEVARNGQRVGVVMLTRPAYRLGEVVSMAIDFTDADIPCYAVHSTLETSERVDPSLAVRSESSIHRVTRKVHAASSEATLYTRRVTFTATIPITATPEFVTSGVCLDWKIRIEFVVPSQGSEDPEGGDRAPIHPLLEKISQDEKGGQVLVAVENLLCESFEIAVPLRVYGAVGTGLERLERDEASEEGLAV
ncbi:Golgi membrane exchange factor (Ric1p-Rgp1p) subunit [Neonectria magnoliae]|uniref:Golgi membrane exchange factor (Ric1p-Rgp1p) subunit n=1 Tax=Neonectria magnoliae TaxID=2732573 RepID=A0ABR1I6K3_9HYPO